MTDYDTLSTYGYLMTQNTVHLVIHIVVIITEFVVRDGHSDS